jgi:hypothetical protein
MPRPRNSGSVQSRLISDHPSAGVVTAMAALGAGPRLGDQAGLSAHVDTVGVRTWGDTVVGHVAKALLHS